jgi:hypothetical protein
VQGRRPGRTARAASLPRTPWASGFLGHRSTDDAIGVPSTAGAVRRQASLSDEEFAERVRRDEAARTASLENLSRRPRPPEAVDLGH